MARNYKLERLQNGESFLTSEKGNSMVPLIKSSQKHKLEPVTWEEIQVGDIAYCKVKGNWYTHLVTAKNEKRGCQISNNQGYVNGWTKAVYGVVVEVVGGKHKKKKKKKQVMSKVLVKTEYNWADEISFPSWEVWDEKEFEEAKQAVKEYWENGGKQFDICVGTNEEVDFRSLDDCLGQWCFKGGESINDSDAAVLKRLFNGAHGEITFSRVLEYTKQEA